MVNLSEEEYKSKKYKTQFESFGIVDDFEEAELIGANIIEQKPNGSCYYLINNKCSIHKTKPVSCRNFFCSSKDKKFREMIKTIKASKRV
ncbi:MAG: hypothetical protein KKE98_01625 [Nanoarchaeota archaeon]|nr:hypothetical protein [Nanoarchaeota archaeon]MBU1597119.1 hypothetical protein [Nanoarchaeota archaeon]MBU2442138.1 hypothetical protein [Nanoarchaeota archaeon]